MLLCLKTVLVSTLLLFFMDCLQLDANIQKDVWIDLEGDPKKLHGKYAGRVHFLVEYKPMQSCCTESHLVKQGVEQRYLPTDLMTGPNNRFHVPGEPEVVSDTLLKSNAIAMERMLAKESVVVGDAGNGNNAVVVAKTHLEEPAIISDPVVNMNIAIETFLSEELGVVSDAVLVSNDITVERILDQESGVVGEAGTGNNAVAVANCEEPAIISDHVVDKNIAVETFLSEESSLSTCNVHVATEVPRTYHSESSKLLESFNLSKDTMCEGPLKLTLATDMSGIGQASRDLGSPLVEKSCAKEEMLENQAEVNGLTLGTMKREIFALNISTVGAVDRRFNHDSEINGAIIDSRGYSPESGNPDQFIAEHAHQFPSELFEID